MDYDSRFFFNFLSKMIDRRAVSSWLLMALVCIPIIHCQSLMGSCPSDRKSLEIESDSDVFIGAMLDLHRPGEGVFGCGVPSVAGLHYYEALRWAIQQLNKQSGYLNGRDVAESFVPGVQFGIQAYDSCQHKELSSLYLTEMFPILNSGAATCQPSKENVTKTIGIVDASGTSSNSRIFDAINKYLVPVMPLNEATTVPPEQLAKVLAEVVHDISWERVAILHADDEYSLYVTKVFGQISFSGFPCIASMKSFPAIYSPNSRTSLRKIISSLTGKLGDDTGVIVVAHGESLKKVLEELKDSPESSRLQWLFSWIPPSKEFEETLRATNMKQVYSLSPYPEKISDFENYWTKLQDIASSRNSEDFWFLDYATFKKYCRVPGHQGKSYGNTVPCENLVLKESPMESLTRTARFLPAMHAVFTFAHAYRKAWQDKCFAMPGVCEELKMMPRRDFVEFYLEPLQFEHLPETRSPGEVRGQKTNSTARGEIDSMQMALNSYYIGQSGELKFKQVFAYDNQEAKILDSGFTHKPSLCSRKGCTNCISIRQSRIDTTDYDIASNDDFVTVARSEDFLIPIILPIHQSGSNPMECGKTLNPEAVQNLEAALWTLDQINEDPEYLQGVQLGAVVIDSCSSPITVTQRISNFLMEMQQKSPDEFTSSLAAITAGSAEEFAATSAILSPLNVTIVSASDAIRMPEMKDNMLQTSIPVEAKVHAVIHMLKYMGWTYVPVLYDYEENNYELLQLFKKYADENNICLAAELAITNFDHVEVDFIVSQLIEVKKQGAKVIVLWAGEITTNVFLDGLRRAIAAGVVSESDFVIICSGEWVKDLNSFREFDNQTIGALTMKPEQGVVSDFEMYYRRLQPLRNRRNPWFEELQGNKAECFDESCELEAPVVQSTVDMIQAVLAISAGLARLRNDVCHPERGLCPRFLQQSHVRNIFYKYVHETASSRLDFKGEMFTFTKQGYGNIPINVLSFRKGSGNTLTHQKAGVYKEGKMDFASSIIYSAVGEELALEEVLSECTTGCQTCGRQSPDHFVVDSNDQLYIASAVGIHQVTANPLICSSVVQQPNMQLLEALLWAIDQINTSPQILPGVQLGSIVFDTCNSREKASRDISNFLSEHQKPNSERKLPKVDDVIGLVTTQQDEVATSIVDVTSPFDILTLATDIKSTKFNDDQKYPKLLRASLPNDVVADGLVDLLKHFHWNYVSVVYSDNVWNHANLFEAFKARAGKRRVDLATIEKIPMQSSEAFMMNVLNRLKDMKSKGSRVVVLLLDEDPMKSFFSAITKLQDIRRIEISDFVWIGVDNLETFHKFADLSLGAIMLRPSTNTILPFKQYFENLRLDNNTRNPWFVEFWEQATKCRGVACYRRTNVSPPPFLQHPSAPSVINSVLSLGMGLHMVRSTLCPHTGRGLCPAFKKEPALREMLYDVVRASSFMGVQGEMFKFTKKNFAAGTLKLFNFVQVGNNARAFIEVGKFSPDEGLSLNYSKVKAYDAEGKEISLYNVKSECMDIETCQGISEQKDVTMMEIIPKQEFAISAMMPIHSKGKTFFECGELKNDNMFLNLAAFSYAVDQINKNDSILPNIELGGLVFDYCGRRQKAEEQMYAYFSKDANHKHKAKITPKSIIAGITFGETVAKDLAPILKASNVAQIAAPSDPMDYIDESELIYTVPPSIAQVEVIGDLLRRFRWNFVSVVYSNSDFGRSSYYQFAKVAKEYGICLSDVVMLELDSSIQTISSTFDADMQSKDSKVIVLLMDSTELVNNTMDAARRSAILHKYVWVGANAWRFESEALHNSVANVFTVELEGQIPQDFLDFVTGLSPRRHDPIPDSWFEEWWQHHFQCRLRNSPSAQMQYSRVCNGQEKITKDRLVQDKHVYHTIKVVHAIAKELHNFLSFQCPLGNAANSIDDCGSQAREELLRQIKKVISGIDPDCEECGKPGTMFGYNILQLQQSDGGMHEYVEIGYSKDKSFMMEESSIIWSSGSRPESTCRRECGKCSNQLGTAENLANVKHVIFQNFKEIWGITVSSLSILGMVLVIICALYFLMSFPVTVGTTVLGYMILFGLFLLYAVNFAFVISPTEGTCGVRRFGLGLAYAVIFAGMLVKVMNTWRIMGYNGNRILNDGTRLSSPAGLLVIAVGLVIIQIVLSAAWLILMPPKIGAYEMVWRCAPPTTFEEGLVVSLVYVMLLLAITTLFAIMTWQCQDNNRESRWILACSTMVAVIWLAWTILSTQMSPHHRDLTIAVANLINATIIMVCLYLRKVYLYSKLTRQANDQDLKAHLQPSSYPHSVYGSSQKSGAFSALAPVLYGSQASLNGKKLYNGPSSRLELINCPEDNKSDSSGSVQVQAADLYPLDMYDGGSQFQPISSLFGSNHTLVLDDTLTYGR